MAATGSRNETRCLLLDEPAPSLDLAHQASVLTSVRTPARLGTVVVAVFHDLNLAAALADDIVLLAGGRVKAVGASANILKADLLSAAYGCKALTNRTPSDGRSFVLPPPVFSMLDMVAAPQNDFKAISARSSRGRARALVRSLHGAQQMQF